MAVTLTNPSSAVPSPRHELSAAAALRYAWGAYVVLLFVPFLLFVAVIWSALSSSTPGREPVAWEWFIGSMAYLAVVVPGAIFWRSRVFRSYWKGEPVAPSAYLSGMMTVWIALEIGGILSLIGCLVGDMMMPGLIPAAVAFILFTPLWPSGRAMLNTSGASDDHAKYAEPH